MNNFSLLDSLLRLICLLLIQSYFFMTIDRRNLGTCFAFFLSVSFSSDFFACYLDASLFWPLNYQWVTSRLATRAFPSFWLSLVPFRMLWMLVMINKPCHVPHTSWMTTCRKIFTELFCCVCNERVRSWSNASSVTNL